MRSVRFTWMLALGVALAAPASAETTRVRRESLRPTTPVATDPVQVTPVVGETTRLSSRPRLVRSLPESRPMQPGLAADSVKPVRDMRGSAVGLQVVDDMRMGTPPKGAVSIAIVDEDFPSVDRLLRMRRPVAASETGSAVQIRVP